MPPTIQETLLELFDHVRQDPDTLPSVPVEDWQEGSVERSLLSGFHGMLEQVQQRMDQFRQMEQQLREREEQYRSIFEAVIDSLTISRLEDGQVVEVNPAACKMLGYNYEELIGMLPADLVPPDYLPLVAEGLQTLRAGGRNDLAMMTLRKDGTSFPTEVHSTQFTYKGEPHLLTVARDITERVQAEEQLREKEEQYRSVFEASTDGLFIQELEDGRVVEVNPAACEMHGFTHEEFIGLLPTAFIHPDSFSLVTETLQTIQEGGQYHARGLAKHKDGTPYNAEAHVTTFTYMGSPHLLSIVRDITMQVQAEEQLREKEAQYRNVFEATDDGLSINDLDGFFIEANPTYCRMLGYTYEELIGMHYSQTTFPEYYPVLEESARAIEVGDQYQTQGLARRKDGSPLPVEAHATPFTYKGKPHMLGVMRDITERVEAERQLREKEEQYRSVFEATSDGLIIRDMDGYVVEANPAACSMHGYTYEEFIGLHRTDIIDPADHIMVAEYMKAIQAGRSFRGQAVDLRKDGTAFPVEVRGSTFTYLGKPHTLSVLRDIAERVEAEKLLEQRVEDRTRELSSLLEISHTVASTLQLDPLLGLILDQLKTVVDYTGSAILVVEGEDLIILDNRSPIQEVQLMQLRFPLKDLGPIWETMISRETIIMPDVRGETNLARAFRVALGGLGETTFSYVRACMIVPLSLKEQVIGILVLTSSNEEAFTQHHADLALAIANQAAVAIENARLYEQAQALAAIEERQRLARELHDSVSQALYGISLGVHTARMQLDRNPKDLAESLDYVLELAEAALIEMRALIFELRPESLETEGLVTALTKQAAALHARQGIVVQLNLCEEPDLPLKVKQDLYRIAQEALHNTVKHARASQVMLRLDQSNNVVIMEVHDDGRGFDASASFPGHLGLHSMRERVANLGGTFEIESKEGQGTTICIRIPHQRAFQR